MPGVNKPTRWRADVRRLDIRHFFDATRLRPNVMRKCRPVRSQRAATAPARAAPRPPPRPPPRGPGPDPLPLILHLHYSIVYCRCLSRMSNPKDSVMLADVFGFKRLGNKRKIRYCYPGQKEGSGSSHQDRLLFLIHMLHCHTREIQRNHHGFLDFVNLSG